MKKLFFLSLMFVSVPGWAYMMNDVPNMCVFGAFDAVAVFERNTYTCNAGYYLPANTDGCRVCPNGAVCSGGTFEFNETVPQGIKHTAPFTQTQANLCSAQYDFFVPVFEEITSATCASGQYLPKNTLTCASCPNGYTCGGGTYNLDENNDQGIVGNTITVIWNGATQADIDANNAGTVTYGGDIRTPVRPDPSQIPIGKRFVGWTFRKTND